MGHCISLVKPTVAPVQKLLTNKAFVDEANLEQQSNFPRQNIPGHPVNKMTETDIYSKQENIIPENYTKYSVHSSEMGSMNSAKVDNGTAMMNTTHDQAHQKKSNKGRVVNAIWSYSGIGSTCFSDIIQYILCERKELREIWGRKRAFWPPDFAQHQPKQRYCRHAIRAEGIVGIIHKLRLQT